MILFLNVFITNDGISVYDRGRLGPVQDRLDVFKYALASFAVLPFEQAIIYCELDSPYLDRWNELEAFIRSLYPKVTLYKHRNLNQRQWQESLTKLFAIQSDELVWYFCNDDHIFIDWNLDLFHSVHQGLLRLAQSHEYVSAAVSHWAEQFPYYLKGYLSPGEDPIADSAAIEIHPDYFVKKWFGYASVQIVNYRLLKAWWFDHDYGDARMPRTDNSARSVNSPTDIACIIPFREMVRHYDSSSHIDIDINACPPLIIPEGFFENSIRIQYGGKSRRAGYVWVNPCVENYITVDPFGVDYRCQPNDLPLFWKERISEVVHDELPQEPLPTQERNHNLLKLACQYHPGVLEEIAGKISPSLSSCGSEPQYTCTKQQLLVRGGHISIYTRKQYTIRPKISFVVADRSDALHSLQTLSSLAKQTSDRNAFEILLVHLRPKIYRPIFSLCDTILRHTDPALEALGTYNMHRGLNAGVAQAQGEWIVCTDGYTFFPPYFVEKIISLLEHTNGPNSFHIPLESAFPELGKEPPNYIPSKITLIALREHFLDLGGYDESSRFLGNAALTEEIIQRHMARGGMTNTLSPSALLFRLKEPLPAILPEIAHQSAPSSSTYMSTEICSKRNVQNIEGQAHASRDKISAILSQANRALLEQRSESILKMIDGLPSSLDIERQSFHDCYTALLRGDSRTAETKILELDEFFHNEPEFFNLKAIIALVKNDVVQAAEHLQNCVQIDPANLSGLSILAQIRIAQGARQEGLLNYIEAARYYPFNQQVWNSLIQVHQSQR